MATVAEKILLDHRSNADQSYEQGIGDVWKQYQDIVSARAASGDVGSIRCSLFSGVQIEDRCRRLVSEKCFVRWNN